MGLEEHRKEAPQRLGFAIVTVSDSRDLAQDRGGDFLARAVEAAGHEVVWRTLVKDEAAAIRSAAREATALASADLVLFTGGTGIAPRDVTAPTLEAEFSSAIPGFGELFRSLSYAQIGSAAILSRATAGLLAGKVVLALPGSPRALALAMEQIVLPEAAHLVQQTRS